MTDRERCESCIHAKPFGGPNDNRCGAWSCEYINRKEAIEVYEMVKAMREVSEAYGNVKAVTVETEIGETDGTNIKRRGLEKVHK